jgi:hypothetical protein
VIEKDEWPDSLPLPVRQQSTNAEFAEVLDVRPDL